jgi:hypothetical protein
MSHCELGRFLVMKKQNDNQKCIKNINKLSMYVQFQEEKTKHVGLIGQKCRDEKIIPAKQIRQPFSD